MGLFRERIAIDLGTTYSTVACEKAKELWSIPSSIALDAKTKKPVAFGDEAKKMIGKNSCHFDVIRPLKDGVISDFEAAGYYLSYLVHKARKNPMAFHYDVYVCLPWGATAVEVKSYLDRVKDFRTKLRMIREPFAAALGCDLDIFSPDGCTVIDIGGGTVEVSTISHGYMISCHSSREAGNAMDQLIVEKLLREKFFEIGCLTAEQIKIEYGSVSPSVEERSFEVRGIDRKSGGPGRLWVSTEELRGYLNPMAETIQERLRFHMRNLPTALQQNLKDRGLYMVGGGSNLRGWKKRLEEQLSIQVHIPENPQFAVIRGMKKILDDPHRYRSILRISEAPEIAEGS